MRPLAYKQWLLGVLTIILFFNSVDRLALGLVLQDIKVDLDLSDTQLGFLGGIAFTLFYAVMGIPIARWADRGNRVTIIAVTTGLWSAMVALCGAAANFVQLLLIRVGVAVGEAGCVPPAQSLIADFFTRVERPRAMSIYLLGAQAPVLFSYLIGGWVNEVYGWRMVFYIMGLPGLAFALLAWVTLREPRRLLPAQGKPIQPPVVASSPIHLKVVWKTLWKIASFRHLLLAFSIMLFFNAGILQWNPTFFIRSHGLQGGELGTWLALAYAVSIIPGTLLGGMLASRYAPHNERLQLIAMSGSVTAFGLFFLGVYVAPNYYWAFVLLSLGALSGSLIAGPLFAMIQTLVPQQMRAQAIAIIYMFGNLIGLGLGPLGVGLLSDALHQSAGDESLRYALIAFCPGFAWSAWHLWRASETVTRDLAEAQSDAGAPESAPEHSPTDLCPTRTT